MFGLSVLLACILPLLCESSYLDLLSKCSIKDSDCMKNMYQNVINEIGKTGIPEVGIRPIDPMHLDEQQIKVIDDLTLTLKDGIVKGLQKCVVKNFFIDIEKGSGSQEVFCDVLTIKGNFSVSGSSPLVQTFIGGDSPINGGGKAKIKIEKFKMDHVFPFSIAKNENGDTYIDVAYKKIKYTYDIQKATLFAEKIVIAKNDITPLVSTYFNQNWKSILNDFGKIFVDKGADYYFDLLEKFFTGTKTDLFIIEDLTPYVKN